MLEDEFKNIKFKVKIRVSSKQKDMAGFVDKLTNLVQWYGGLPPEVKADPNIQHLINQIAEASGFSPANLGGLTSIEAPLPPKSATRPVRELAAIRE